MPSLSVFARWSKYSVSHSWLLHCIGLLTPLICLLSSFISSHVVSVSCTYPTTQPEFPLFFFLFFLFSSFVLSLSFQTIAKSLSFTVKPLWRKCTLRWQNVFESKCDGVVYAGHLNRDPKLTKSMHGYICYRGFPGPCMSGPPAVIIVPALLWPSALSRESSRPGVATPSGELSLPQ